MINVDENSVLELLYADKETNRYCVTDDENIKKFTSLHNWELNNNEPKTDWFISNEYKYFDVYQYLLGKCKTDEEKDRVALEYKLFEERELLDLLKFLKYFMDTVAKNNLMIGVGRGSSCSCYILFLLDVHQVDSIKYNLDIKEFFK